MRLDQSSWMCDTGWAPQKAIEPWEYMVSPCWIPCAHTPMASARGEPHGDASHVGSSPVTTWVCMLLTATLIWNYCPIFISETALCPFWSKVQRVKQWMTRQVGSCARGWVYFYLGASSVLIRFNTFIKQPPAWMKCEPPHTQFAVHQWHKLTW